MQVQFLLATPISRESKMTSHHWLAFLLSFIPVWFACATWLMCSGEDVEDSLRLSAVGLVIAYCAVAAVLLVIT